MKTEKGITLISVTIYVIAMVMVIAIISSLTGYFYNNVNMSTENDDINLQYTKFNSFFSEEVNKQNNKILEVNNEEEDISYIIFSSKNQYTFIKLNKAIYLNNVKIANNIEECKFTTEIKNGNDVVNVTIKAKNFETTTSYTLRK